MTDEVDAALIEQQKWTFNRATSSANLELVNLSPFLDEAVLQLRKEVPLQLVVNMFQKMVGLSLCCTLGRTDGLIPELATCAVFPSGEAHWSSNQD